MWIVRELLRLGVRVAIGFAIALVIAVLWATVSEHSFAEGLRETTLSVGVLLLLMAGIGRGSNFERAMDYGVAHQYWGRIPGVSTIERKPEDRTLTPGAVFALTGLALLALGLFVL